MSFELVERFENKIANFFGSKHAVAVDCCTHGVELCLRYKNVKHYTVPKRTYISISFLAKKLNINFEWREEDWQDYYYLGNTNIIDAAVLWEKDSYKAGTLMVLSFQFRKHLNLGRGGAILTDCSTAYNELKKMSYDGRLPDVPWREQDISSFGLHYYMTPETAAIGLEKINNAIKTKPKKWKVTDWPDLSKMSVFKNEENK